MKSKGYAKGGKAGKRAMSSNDVGRAFQKIDDMKDEIANMSAGDRRALKERMKAKGFPDATLMEAFGPMASDRERAEMLSFGSISDGERAEMLRLSKATAGERARQKPMKPMKGSKPIKMLKSMKGSISDRERAAMRSPSKATTGANISDAERMKMAKGGMMKSKGYAKGGMKQGYNARLDDSLGSKNGKKDATLKARRDESEGMEESMGKRKFSGNKGSGQKTVERKSRLSGEMAGFKKMGTMKHSWD